MITYTKGNIFDSKMDAIVNPVNTVGVMGKGLALQMKIRYPLMFRSYKSACERGMIETGKIYISRNEGRTILLFPTKKHWRNPSEYTYIEEGLKYLVKNYRLLNLKSIAFPRIGCGCGGLDWSRVKAMLEKYLKDTDLEIEIYE